MTSAKGEKSRDFTLLQQNKPSDHEKDASAAVLKARLSLFPPTRSHPASTRPDPADLTQILTQASRCERAGITSPLQRSSTCFPNEASQNDPRDRQSRLSVSYPTTLLACPCTTLFGFTGEGVKKKQKRYTSRILLGDIDSSALT